MMKKLIASLVILFAVSITSVQATPDYAKWGSIAVKEAQKRFNADIIDYKHIGRTDLTPKKSEEKFKLWIRNSKGKKFGIYVLIQFDPSTERIHAIQFTNAESATTANLPKGSD